MQKRDDLSFHAPWHAPRPEPKTSTPVEIAEHMVIEDVRSGFVGEVLWIGKVGGQWNFRMEDRHGNVRSFPLGPGYWIEGVPVTLTPPQPRAAKPARTLTASGSFSVRTRARTARASRIWVEGKHDAELVFKIWGEDLAGVGVVVEELGGIDHLLARLADFDPSQERRVGVLVDHLVEGSKEWRLAHEAMKLPGVLVLGHPYIDVWQAIKPECIGIPAWPQVPRGEDIKVGTLTRLGLPARSTEDIGKAWATFLNRVQSYKDLEPSLLGRMEELIDFVTREDYLPH